MSSRPASYVYSPTAAVLAWMWPGLGHLSLGDHRRGLLLMFGVLFLVVTGLLVGGVDSVDRKNDRLWYLAQVMCGPIVIAADVANQHFVQRPQDDWRRDRDLRARYLAGDPEVLDTLRRVGLSRVNEVGTLYVALAGLMNLVVILDAFCTRVPEPRSAGA